MAYISEALRRSATRRRSAAQVQYARSHSRTATLLNAYVTIKKHLAAGCILTIAVAVLISSFFSDVRLQRLRFRLKRFVDSVVIKVAIVDFDAFLNVF